MQPNAAIPHYRRVNTQGGAYFFTVNTSRRQPVLIEEMFEGVTERQKEDTANVVFAYE